MIAFIYELKYISLDSQFFIRNFKIIDKIIKLEYYQNIFILGLFFKIKKSKVFFHHAFTFSICII